MKEAIQIKTKAFPTAGIYIMRSERIYLLAVCHPIGVNRHGPHKHNDWLSFELCVDGQPVIIDPGTYCYTGNMKIRRLFRSTSYHNTVVVDGEEQIPINNSMFGLTDPHGEVKVLRWETDAICDLLEAEHTGYTRLIDPVIHRRSFLLNKKKDQLEITDTFLSMEKHTLEGYLHLDVGLGCQVEGQKVIISKKQRPFFEITFSDCSSTPQIQNEWISRSYNRCEDAKVIYWSWRADVGTDIGRLNWPNFSAPKLAFKICSQSPILCGFQPVSKVPKNG
jgi:hypothetical protein